MAIRYIIIPLKKSKSKKSLKRATRRNSRPSKINSKNE
jgi:hypothetical protein